MPSVAVVSEDSVPLPVLGTADTRLPLSGTPPGPVILPLML
jgi:hypothetical protein